MNESAKNISASSVNAPHRCIYILMRGMNKGRSCGKIIEYEYLNETSTEFQRACCRSCSRVTSKISQVIDTLSVATDTPEVGKCVYQHEDSVIAGKYCGKDINHNEGFDHPLKEICCSFCIQNESRVENIEEQLRLRAKNARK